MIKNQESVGPQKVFGPCSEKQRLILMDNETDVILAGGGAGGGKSRCVLTKAIAFVQDPAARVIILRQTMPQLKVSGGLVDESHEIYPYIGGVYKVQAGKWIFPNGASIQFSAIPDDAKLEDWKGSQLTHILIDEAAEWTERQVVFLLTRLRSAKFKGKLQLIMTCNPNRTSFLYEWVKPILDEITGIPKDGTEYITRWFVNIGGKMQWGTSPEDLYTRFGVGKKLGEDFMPKSFKFYFLTVYDNPVLMKANPDYLASLLAQPKVDQQRFLHGSWTAVGSSEGYFKRDWVEIVKHPPEGVTARWRCWDFAASAEPSDGGTNRNPDYTAGVKMSRDKFGRYYVEDCYRFRKRTDEVLKEVVMTAFDDDLDNCRVAIPIDPGAAGQIANTFFVKTLAENGVGAKSIKTSGHNSKLSLMQPFLAMAERGMIKVVEGAWNEEWFTELETFEAGNRNQHDDMWDATGMAFRQCSQQIQSPTIVVPDMSRQSIVSKMK